MRKPLTITLLALILIPAILLAWFGITLYQDRQQMAQDRQLRLAQLELHTLDEQLLEYFREHERIHLPTLNFLQLDKDRLRELAKSDPLIRQAFVINARGERVFPPRDEPLSNREQAFLNESKPLWSDPDLIGAQAPIGQVAMPQAQQYAPNVGNVRALSFGNRAAEAIAPVAEPGGDEKRSGWTIWFEGIDRHFALWQKREDGNVVGIELNPARVVSDLILRLPDGSDAEYRDHRVRLIGPSGQLLYQWGDSDITIDGKTPIASAAMSFPLHGWRAEFFADVTAGDSGIGWLIALLILLPLLLSGGFYLYREHSREMREAGQRVSFVNQVSHELKTPLTNIRMYAEMLEERVDPEDERSLRYANVIGEESRRLSRMIANVLSFAREDRGALRIQPRAVVPDDCVEAVVESFRAGFESKGIAIERQGSVPTSLVFDPDCLEQILGNLLSNIEKYAADGGLARIQLAHDAHQLRMTVCDRGEGIPTAERERIFQPFHRVSSKLTDGVAGTGIGLSIAKRLAQLHGGDLTLISSDRGACFEVSLNVKNEGES